MARLASRSNPVVRYRWLLAGGDAGYGWLNGRGLLAHEVPGGDDFVARRSTPGARSGTRRRSSTRSSPTGSLERRATSSRRSGRCGATGTAAGGTRHRTPRASGTAATSPASSSTSTTSRARRERDLHDAVLPGRQHAPLRRDVFDRVDPLLGGDEALASLVRAAHARGMRSSATSRSTTSATTHEWFERALAATRRAGARASSTSTSRCRTDTRRGWASARCRSSIGARRSSTTACAGSFDVARRRPRRVAHRRREHDRPLSRLRPQSRRRRVGTREVVAGALLIAEHGHDFRPDLDGRGWHGVMNYSGFLRPVVAVASRRPRRARMSSRSRRRRPTAAARRWRHAHLPRRCPVGGGR